MSSAKMIFKINFTSPDKPRQKWMEAEWKKNRAFYTCNASYNYMTYSLNGKKVAKNSDYMNYMQRLDEEGNRQEEKSTGAFGLKREYSAKELKEIKEKLRQTKSIIWHGFISFDKDLSKNFNNQEDCIKYVRATFNTLLENSHLNKNNITMIFSLHTDTNNRHIHFEFFENAPKRVNAKGEKEYTKKGALRIGAIDNFMVSSGLYFEDTKYQLSTARDEALDCLKEYCPSVRVMGGYKRYSDDIKNKLLELADKIPKEGRTAYNSSNMKYLREEVDKVVNYIVTSDNNLNDKVLTYANEIEGRKERVYELMKSQKFAYIKSGARLNKEDMQIIFEGKDGKLDPTKIGEWADLSKIRATERLERDLKARLGNYVINLAKGMNECVQRLDERKLLVSNKSKKIAAKTKRQLMNEKLDQFLKNIKRNGFKYRDNIQTNFMYSLHKVEKEIERENNTK